MHIPLREEKFFRNKEIDNNNKRIVVTTADRL
jgi:hypothetical protein